jgi:hypothetical protein
MKKLSKIKQLEKTQEELIQNALRTGGFLFPKTVAEVEEFEKKFGITNVTLPEDLQVPNFLHNKTKKPTKAKVIGIQGKNFAMAAREENTLKLSEETLALMEEDRKKADAALRKNKKKK